MQDTNIIVVEIVQRTVRTLTTRGTYLDICAAAATTTTILVVVVVLLDTDF